MSQSPLSDLPSLAASPCTISWLAPTLSLPPGAPALTQPAGAHCSAREFWARARRNDRRGAAADATPRESCATGAEQHARGATATRAQPPKEVGGTPPPDLALTLTLTRTLTLTLTHTLNLNQAGGTPSADLSGYRPTSSTPRAPPGDAPPDTVCHQQ